MQKIFIDKVTADTSKAALANNSISGECLVVVSNSKASAADGELMVVPARFVAAYSELGFFVVTSLAATDETAYRETRHSTRPELISDYKLNIAEYSVAKQALASWLSEELASKYSPLRCIELFPNTKKLGAVLALKITNRVKDIEVSEVVTLKQGIVVTPNVDLSSLSILFTADAGEIIEIIADCDMSDKNYHLSDNPVEPQCNICVPLSSIKTKQVTTHSEDGSMKTVFDNYNSAELDGALSALLVRSDINGRLITYMVDGRALNAIEFIEK